MRRRTFVAIAVPILICVPILFVSFSSKTPACKGTECCMKKHSKPVNQEMIMESLPRQFISVIR